MPTSSSRSTLPVILVSVALVIVGGLLGWFLAQRGQAPQVTSNQNQNRPAVTAAVPAAALDSATFDIDGQRVALVGGSATVEAEEGDGVTETFLREPTIAASGDLNGDGKDDAAGILLYNSSGTGVFAYVVALVSSPTGPQAVRGVALGDRLLFDRMTIADGILTVRYLDREPDEAMVAIPTISKQRRLRVVMQGDTYVFSGVPAMATTCDSEDITVQTPASNSTISFPLTVTAVVDNTQGTTCTWTVFEAQAGLVELKNNANVVVVSVPLMTAANWMTATPVTYTATLQPSPVPPPGPYALVITEENPSGEGTPGVVSIPVTF